MKIAVDMREVREIEKENRVIHLDIYYSNFIDMNCDKKLKFNWDCLLLEQSDNSNFHYHLALILRHRPPSIRE